MVVCKTAPDVLGQTLDVAIEERSQYPMLWNVDSPAHGAEPSHERTWQPHDGPLHVRSRHAGVRFHDWCHGL